MNATVEQTIQKFDARVKTEIAAQELQMDVLTLRLLMQQGKLQIGYVVKKEGKARSSYYIYRGLLNAEKERLGLS